jgi:hypothetical protein
MLLSASFSPATIRLARGWQGTARTVARKTNWTHLSRCPKRDKRTKLHILRHNFE